MTVKLTVVAVMVGVTLATSKAPSARIVVNLPANFVKNGSKIFFNKNFHGRLLLSEKLNARMRDFQQFGKSVIIDDLFYGFI